MLRHLATHPNMPFNDYKFPFATLNAHPVFCMHDSILDLESLQIMNKISYRSACYRLAFKSGFPLARKFYV